MPEETDLCGIVGAFAAKSPSQEHLFPVQFSPFTSHLVWVSKLFQKALCARQSRAGDMVQCKVEQT